ncbi:ABC transporter substrate-binding protein [Litorivicinus lipolyticus]|uniref:ABC transporter substrate-binding protein n=1 Tax=Litorivicinus lipolyticus TaxID=418701 RepID=A0A5Q2QCN1_9GAMM|nr:ABC transporter substrate-binding protein [Litorivicinus lipolyticus]QGG80081.1 ABC transporter substrate-binding protein [Litorivicinus lipolyticus]
MLKRQIAAAVALSALAAAPLAMAETLRWARSGDSLTMDPHAQNEGTTHTLAHQIYEPLLQRDMAGQIIPALATSWATLPGNPNVWRLELREGVKFHGGEDFTSEDAVFSINRAMMETSDMKGLLTSIKSVSAPSKFAVDIETNGANPLLINNLTNLFMMDKGWTEANGSVTPQDFANGETTFASSNTNGTGAFELVSRTPDERTVLTANPNYWGKGQFPLEVTEVIFTPIQSAATRVAALLSGEVDFVQDAPVQDLKRVDSADGLRVATAAQNRVIFFGMNQGKADLETDNVDGANPFADRRVREAMNMAINRSAIQQVVMRGQSDPTGVIMPPFVNGWTAELGQVPANDMNKAKGLMAEAGYGDGFSITLNCPNDRYINDEAICQAAVGMLGQIGVKVNLDAKPKAQHFPLIQNKTTEFYMLGWGVPTFDSHYIFNFLAHTSEGDRGPWNNTGYSNASVDSMIVSLESETDLAARDATIGKIWKQLQEDILYLPVHNQVLNWSMRDDIKFDVQPEDQPHFKFLSFN